MNAIVVNYVQIVCVTLFMSNNVNCEQLMSQEKEVQTFKVSTCMAQCLNNSTIDNHGYQNSAANVTSNLEHCYNQCYSDFVRGKIFNEPKVIQSENLSNNFSFHLFCRDSSRLTVEFDLDNFIIPKSEKFMYIIEILETDATFNDYKIYLSDNPLIEMTNLTSQTSYNLSSMIISSENLVYKLEPKTYTTLKRDFVPETITDITIDGYNSINLETKQINVAFKWEPARDETCSYEFVIHCEGSDSILQYQHTFPKLFYRNETVPIGARVNVAIRGQNSLLKMYESETFWITLQVDDCMTLMNDSSFCGPDDIEDLEIHATNVYQNVFDITLEWSKPSNYPESYELDIRELQSTSDFESTQLTIDGNATSYTVRNVTLNGHMFFIEMRSKIGNLTKLTQQYPQLEYTKFPAPKKEEDNNWEYWIITLGSLSILLILISFFFYASLLTKQKPENMDLDLITSITNRSILEAIEELTKDDRMEIDRDNIKILNDLGEGAFGYVKKGIVIKDDMKMEVAVKMLKNSSNLEDIKQFHQEITVMKSVGRHPNIVSIIGHCTSNIQELMLLTEFCESGNLLDLLRREFAKQLRFYDNKNSTASDVGIVEEDEGNFSCQSSKLFVSNQLYDELNNNRRSSTNIEITATNTMYFEFNEKYLQQVTIEMPQDASSNVDEFLTSYDLISFAKQVSDGMNFLARKKVVHRDLASRNVLVCGRHVKICDFGLSRDIHRENVYRKTGSGKLPIKWLALESLTHQVYTSQSDVWSFGVLLYEIITLGATPYPSIGADQLMKLLSTGYRMDRPNHCHASLDEIMQSCWLSTPQARPTFDELSTQLQGYLALEKSGDINLVDLSKFFDRCLDDETP